MRVRRHAAWRESLGRGLGFGPPVVIGQGPIGAQAVELADLDDDGDVDVVVGSIFPDSPVSVPLADGRGRSVNRCWCASASSPGSRTWRSPISTSMA